MQKQTLNAKFVSSTPVQLIGEKNTKVRTITVDITENPQYPNCPVFQLIGDRCAFGDQLRTGDEIKLEYVIEARNYTKDGENRTITNLNVLNIFRTALTSLSLPNQTQPEPEEIF